MKNPGKYIMLLLAVCSLILVSSCRKETEEPEIKPDENIEILEGQTLIYQEFSKNLSSSTLENAISNTINWVKSQPYVASANSLYNGIEVIYKSGMIGLIVHFEWDQNGKIIGKKDGGINLSGPDFVTNYKQSLIKENVGPTPYSKATDNEPIGNKKVLVWSPVQGDMDENMPDTVGDIFAMSDIDLDIDYITNEDCTIESVKEFEKYGLILIDAHGWRGQYISTGVEATEIKKIWYSEDLLEKRLAVLTFKLKDGTLKNLFLVTNKFVTDYCGLTKNFPNSVIFNGTCESTMCDSLSSAFISKGVKTYYGFNRAITARFVVFAASMIIENMTNWYFNTGQSFVPEMYDLWYGRTFLSRPGKLEIKGSEEMAYLQPYWQGTLNYQQQMNRSLDEGEGYVKTWNINIEAKFNLKLEINDPYLGPDYFVHDNLTGSLSIDYNYVSKSPYSMYSVTASCSDDKRKVLLSNLTIDRETNKYTFVFAFDNTYDNPCIASCSDGTTRKIEVPLYLTSGMWPPKYGQCPGHGTFAEDYISREWQGPAPELPDIGILDDCKIKWELVKIVP